MEQEQLKILLIEPPFFRLFKETYSLNRVPLALGYLSGVIKKETNWEVMSYNSDFCPDDETIKLNYFTTIGFDNYLNNLKDSSSQVWAEVKATLLEYQPAVVGISAKSQNFASACMVAKLVKKANQSTLVVVGGPHPSMVGPEILNCPDIDIGVKGEGEETLVELLKAIETGREFDNIPGIIYRKNSRVVENSSREFIKDLDSLPFPHESAPEVIKDYDLYPITAFRNVFVIRGCPYNCAFCGSHKIWSHKPRFRSIENIIEEIKGLQRIGLKVIRFDDDTFGVNKQYLNDLCQALIKHCPGLKWNCELHVKLVDEQTISLMKKAGCISIQVGIESGSNRILKEMRKNITIEEAFSACEIIKKNGIILETFFLVGFPQETEDTLNDTLAAIKKIKSDAIQYSIFTPYPGTKIFDFCKEQGLISDDYDPSLHNHQSPKSCFCINLSLERFRILASIIEKIVDRKNWQNRVRLAFSWDTFRKIQEYGPGRSLRKAIQLCMGK